MDIELDEKNLSKMNSVEKTKFESELNEEQEKKYRFITRAYFLTKEELDRFKSKVEDDFKNQIINLLEDDCLLVKKYEEFFIDHIRNFAFGEVYDKLKNTVNGDLDERRKVLANYIRIMDEFELTYEEEIEFGNFVIEEYKNNNIFLKGDLEKEVEYLEERYGGEIND